MLKKILVILSLPCLLSLTGKSVYSQTRPDSIPLEKISINYPDTLRFDYFSFEMFEVFKSELSLVAGSTTFCYQFDTFLVKANYDLQSLRGVFTSYNKENKISSAGFILSEIKEKRNGDSIIYYRDILRDGNWFYKTDTTEILSGVFDNGILLSQTLYKGDLLLEGGHYKNGKPIGEWVSTGEEFSDKIYFDYKSDRIYMQVITLSDRKLKREYYRELFEKTTRLNDLDTPVDFWYIVDYDKQGAVSARGHYMYSITGTSFGNTPDWDYIPYGVHYVYENGKEIRKKYKDIPKEIKYSIYKYDDDGNTYKVEYAKKLN